MKLVGDKQIWKYLYVSIQSSCLQFLSLCLLTNTRFSKTWNNLEQQPVPLEHNNQLRLKPSKQVEEPANAKYQLDGF